MQHQSDPQQIPAWSVPALPQMHSLEPLSLHALFAMRVCCANANGNSKRIALQLWPLRCMCESVTMMS